MSISTAPFSTAVPGDTLHYVISFRNNGPGVVVGATITDNIPDNTKLLGVSQGGAPLGSVLTWKLNFPLNPGMSGGVFFDVQVNPGTPDQTVITNQAQITVAAQQYTQNSNTVTTTVASTALSYAGTWSAIPPTDHAVSLTVDPQNKFTVWAVSKDRQTVARAAQGQLNPDGSFDVFSADNLVHFTGQVAADRQSAKITAARQGFVTFSVTAPRATDVDALPNTLVGTFNGSGVAANGDRLQVRLSIDPGGNSTFEGEVVQPNSTTGLLQFNHFSVTSDGRLDAGILQVQNNKLVLTYNYQDQARSYQNTFQVPLQPFPP